MDNLMSNLNTMPSKIFLPSKLLVLMPEEEAIHLLNKINKNSKASR